MGETGQRSDAVPTDNRWIVLSPFSWKACVSELSFCSASANWLNLDNSRIWSVVKPAAKFSSDGWILALKWDLGVLGLWPVPRLQPAVLETCPSDFKGQRTCRFLLHVTKVPDLMTMWTLESGDGGSPGSLPCLVEGAVHTWLLPPGENRTEHSDCLSHRDIVDFELWHTCKQVDLLIVNFRIKDSAFLYLIRAIACET